MEDRPSVVVDVRELGLEGVLKADDDGALARSLGRLVTLARRNGEAVSGWSSYADS